jgi:acetyltransferase-like isoleucine patch superfamily enzyme
MGWENTMLIKIIDFIKTQRDKIALRKAIKEGLQIGEGSQIMGTPIFDQPYLVRIGKHVSIATGVEFFTYEGGTFVFRHLPGSKGMYYFDTIDIRDNCLIGTDAILMPGITIGPNSVVGANAVVTKNVPPNTVVVGCPARHLCTYQEFVERLLPKCRHIEPDVIKNPKKLHSFLMSAMKAERGEQIFGPSLKT